jgi:long-chain acyl-CoA synthetase
MLGYWQRPEETRDAVDADGWLHTGDIAELRDEHLFLRGRLSETLVTSTGENVAAGCVEQAITMDPLILQALVIGSAQPHLGALLVLERDVWTKLCAELDLDPDDPASLQTEAVRAAVPARLQTRLQALPKYAQVRAVHLSLEPWPIDKGHLTPTMKVKWAALQRDFKEQIEALYAGHAV